MTVIPIATALATLFLSVSSRPLKPTGISSMKNGVATFAFMVNQGDREVEAVILAQSIRDFGGGMAGNSIWAMVPKSSASISKATLDRLRALDVRVEGFPVEGKALGFPLAAKVYAAASAESLARSETPILAWLDSDNIVVREPKAFILPADKALGYRPVMLKNISSMYDEPVDGFWELIYNGCGTTPERVFSVTTTVDGTRIRAQFNAGLLVVRPEWGLLRAWRDNFDKLYRQEAFRPYYRSNPLYAVFIHQAVLAGTVLSYLVRSEMQELPEDYNYPLMFHERTAEDKNPMIIDHLTTLRYDEYSTNPLWLDNRYIGEPLLGWLKGFFRKGGRENEKHSRPPFD